MVPSIHPHEGEAMARGRPLKPLEVNRDTRQALASLARWRSLPAGLVCRAGIVLLCAAGLDNPAISTSPPFMPPGSTRSGSGSTSSRRRPSAAAPFPPSPGSRRGSTASPTTTTPVPGPLCGPPTPTPSSASSRGYARLFPGYTTRSSAPRIWSRRRAILSALNFGRMMEDSCWARKSFSAHCNVI